MPHVNTPAAERDLGLGRCINRALSFQRQSTTGIFLGGWAYACRGCLPRMLAEDLAWEIGGTMSGQELLIILLVGLVAGWLAGQIVRGTGYGLIADMAIGIVGA